MSRSVSPRIAIFTHDTFGMGHVRRCLHIARGISEREPNAAILLITGSPALHAFAALPPNLDVLKIPTVVKTGAKSAQPPHLRLPIGGVPLLRQRLVAEAVRTFAPDVLLVDNFPLGSQGELLPILQELRGTRTRAVLGLRDIVDAPEAVCADWRRHGIYDVLDRCYDRVLVYGMPQVLDIEQAYALPQRVAEKVRYCGYITAAGPLSSSPSEVRSALGFREPFLLATGGGGGDALPLLLTVAEALPLLPEVPAAIVTGPLMSAADRAELRARINGRGDVRLIDFVDDLRSYLAAASVVVSMGGYNTTAEIVSLRARAVLVPRTWRYGEHRKGRAAGDEWEQMLRAQALSRAGLAELVEPEGLTGDLLAERVRLVLGRPAAMVSSTLDFGGLERAVDEMLEADS